jgi:transketolase N-terminal domain/subunit
MERLSKLAALVRYYILACSTQAGSGHPTSSLSAVDAAELSAMSATPAPGGDEP